MAMRARLLTLIAALLLLLAACGGSSDDTSNEQPATTGAVTTDSTAEPAEDDVPEPSDTEGEGTIPPETTETPETPETTVNPTIGFEIDPVGSGQAVDDLIAEAAADGNVTGEELTEILEVSGTPEAQATCEGDLLAQLGITDPTDVEALQQAAALITEDQQIELSTQLSTCIAAGGN